MIKSKRTPKGKHVLVLVTESIASIYRNKFKGIMYQASALMTSPTTLKHQVEEIEDN